MPRQPRSLDSAGGCSDRVTDLKHPPRRLPDGRLNPDYERWRRSRMDREKERERCRTWRREHPEQSKEIARRYRSSLDPELRRERGRRHVSRSRDRNEALGRPRYTSATYWANHIMGKVLEIEGCHACGFNKSHVAMDWHHVDPATKWKCVGLLGALKSKLEESLKCVPLCA